MAQSRRRRDALEYHRSGRPGKLQIAATKALTSQRDLSLAYSPGVAEPCLEIQQDPSTAYQYTARGNLVAVISNGTAVLGLGDIGPLASKPVMEGKAVLFKKFADIDVFDLELDASDPDRFIDCVAALEPTFGGINLEDIKAPECFYIEQKLRERLKIPVFHDDQHGTAIISGAALLNAAELQGKKVDTLKMVVSGAGASAVACTRFYMSLGVRAENILMCDSKGVLRSARKDLTEAKKEFARDVSAETLADALEGADLFLGLSKGGLVSKAMVAKMADRPIIFALANPDPEIGYKDAKEARPDAIVATGRSDFDNQVNNVLGFPGIFRGALDVRATCINEEMKIAAARALAQLARKTVPDEVNRAYNDDYSFGPDYIIPKPFDPRVIQEVAFGVAEAAVQTKVAQIDFDPGAYREQLRGLLGGSTAIMRKFIRKAKSDPRTIVFPEGDDPRILHACAVLCEEGIARPILLGRKERICARLKEQEIELDDSLYDVVHPESDPRYAEFAKHYFARRDRKGIDARAARRLMARRNFFGMMMVEQGHADGVVSGVRYPYPESLIPALQIIGLRRGAPRTAGMHMMLHRQRPLFFADTTVDADSTAESLAEIAIMVADEARGRFGVHPRIAMLSFSNFGSAPSASSNRVAKAVEIVRGRRPDLEVEGEMQANVAVDFELQQRRYPFTQLSGPANVLVFPDLDAGNVAYQLMRELGGVQAVGPVLVGMRKPVTVLERDSSVDTIVQMAALTVVQAQAGVSEPVG